MEIKVLKELVEKGYSTRKIAEELGSSQTNIRYWLKKHNLKTDRSLDLASEDKTCPRCHQFKKKSEFYSRRNKNGSSPYCKECTKLQALERQRALKKKAVDYKGGKCSQCGYSGYIGALEFHHIDPKEKDFSVAKLSRTSWGDTIKKELDKCVLLCANCHREEHAILSGVYER